MEVSIIIVNYNTLKLTRECIDSVFEKTHGVTFEIILVDNASTDGSRSFFERDNRITYVYSEHNLGFGRANNVGLKYAHGEYIFFLNSDTILLNDAITMFKKFMDSHEDLNIGALGCLLVNRDGERIHSYSSFPTIKEAIKNDLYSCVGKKENILEKGKDEVLGRDYVPVDYVTGADMFVRRSVIDKYGAFDEDFFLYYEETEMQYRWHSHGLCSYIIQAPQIAHLVGGAQKSSYKKQHIILKSRLLYFKKITPRWVYIIYRVYYLFQRLLLLIFLKKSQEERKEYIKILFDFNCKLK